MLPILFLLAFFQLPAGVVSGRVIRIDNPTGVAGVPVFLRSNTGPLPWFNTTTDVTGGFEFRNVLAGEYKLTVQGEGIAPGEFGRKSPYAAPSILSVQSGEQLKDLVMPVFPVAMISGHIKDTDSGSSIAGVVVQLLREDFDSAGILRLNTVTTAATDAEGRYRLEGLTPDRYKIATMAASKSGEVYTPAFYPNATDERAARSIDLAPGQDLSGVDFAVSRTRKATIRGELVDGLYRNIPHLDWISLTRRFPGDGVERQQRLRNQSKFEITDVTPGSYYVTYFRFDDENRATSHVRVDVGHDDVENVVVISGAACPLTGRVRTGGFTIKPGSIKFAFRSIEDPARTAPSGWVRPDGILETVDLGCGRSRLSVDQLPEGIYLKSARLGARDVLKDGLVFPATTRNLDIVLARDGGRLEGVVVDAGGGAVKSAHVVMVPRTNGMLRSDLFKTANTDQYGRFAIRDIAPEMYDVYAWEELAQRAYYDAEFMKSFEGLGRRVVIGPNAIVNTQIVLIPANR